MGLPAVELNEQLSLDIKKVFHDHGIDMEVVNDGLPDVDRTDLVAYAYKLIMNDTALLCMHSVRRKHGRFEKSHIIFLSIVGKVSREEKDLFRHVKKILIEKGGKVVA